METKTTILTASSFINYSEPIIIIQDCFGTEFYDISKIVWKYKFGTSGFDYNGKFIFQIADERISTLQADSLSSLSSVACVSNANLCVDRECPKVVLGAGLRLHLSGTPPTQGDGEVIIETHFSMDDINRIYN
jgi:hypothetical protein